MTSTARLRYINYPASTAGSLLGRVMGPDTAGALYVCEHVMSLPGRPAAHAGFRPLLPHEHDGVTIDGFGLAWLGGAR